MIKNIIFDVDGTLLDTKEASLMALQQTLAEDYHIPTKITDLEFAFSGTAKDTLNYFNIPESQHADAAASVLKNAFNFIDEVKPFAGILETVQQLIAKKIALAIVTSEDQWEFETIFKKTTLNPYFSRYVTADQVQQPKPAAEPALKALQLLQAQPAQTLLIGDSRNDIDCAHQAQIAFGLAKWGANPDVDFSDAEYIFTKPQEILKLL
ncbi:HAD family hydrolase [Bombilactobacillus folatiphilus]|uniref:HAD family hydrolase n=1 Tax=Bombilactobacillus folatiphilus TaxID=2923362 RepID=A0ABY4P8C0_9LACO|nr:HAD family hydrolase [Bombilactobacillus folatiphilus]UQS81869.1 HAD family hydrolase [Bombilactobacillus folatiphilus]